MKLIVCSDRDSIRERWRSILAKQGYVTYQAALFEGIKQVLLKDQISLIMLHQPSLDMQTVGQFCKELEPTKIFIFSDEPKPQEGLFFLRQFAAGYANTYISPGRLLEAVKMILSGKVWFNQDIINKLIQSINVQADQSDSTNLEQALSSLSQREKEIAILVSKGLSNQAIAEKLFISDRTVKTHLGTIFQKTDSQNRLQLALMIHGIKS